MKYFSIAIFQAILFLLLPYTLFADQSLANLESRLNKAENDSLRIELLRLMGDHFKESDFDSAVHFYQQAIETAENALQKKNSTWDENIYKSLKTKAYNDKAIANILWGNYDEAFSIYEILLELTSETGNMEYYTSTLKEMGSTFYYQGKYPQALEYYNKAEIAAKEHNLIRQMADITLNKGTVYYLMGHYDKSLQYHQNAFDLYESADLSFNHVIIYLGKGNIYSELSEQQKAMEQYERALQLCNEDQDHLLISNIQLSIGSLYYEMDSFSRAEEHYLIALEHARKLHNRRIESQTLLNLSINYAAIGDFSKAEEALEQAREYALKSKNQHILANILRNMANLNLRQGNMNKALGYARQSLEIGRTIESVESQSLAFRVISEILEKQENFREALSNYQSYKSLNDSLLDFEKQKKITEMDAVYQSEKQAQALELKQLELDKNQSELTQKKQLANIFIIAFALLLISSVIIFIINNKRIRTDRLVNEKLAIINKKQDIIFELEKLSQLQGNRILKLEKSIAEIEKAHANEREFAERLRSNMLPGHELLTAILTRDSFVFSSGEKGLPPKGFLWVKKIDEKLIITLIGCDFEGIRESLINIYMTAMLEKFSQNKYLNDPRLMSENIMKQLDHLAQEMNIGNKHFSAALLWIDTHTKKVIFSGSRISLYLAISRDHGKTPVMRKYEYQELQKPKPDNTTSVKALNNEFDAMQLKKTDRLYMVASCKKDKAKKTDLNKPEESEEKKIVQLIDQNQDMEIQKQKAVLHDYSTRSNNNTISTVIGIEL